MDLEGIKELVARGEGKTTEFKRKINFPEKVVREMVAFANTAGGYLLVGIDDDGTIPGLKSPEEHDYALSKAVKELSVPNVKYDLITIPLTQKKSVLCYQVRVAARKPHYAKEKAEDRYGRAYVRVDDKTVKASREMTQILRRGNTKNGQGFSYGEHEGLLMKLLDRQDEITLKHFMKEAEITKHKASSILIRMVLAGVLEIVPNERTDIFKLKNF